MRPLRKDAGKSIGVRGSPSGSDPFAALMHQQPLLGDAVAEVALDLDNVHGLRLGARGKRLDFRSRAVSGQQVFADAEFADGNPGVAVFGSGLTPFRGPVPE